VNTYGSGKVGISDGEIAKKVAEIFDMRPAAIIRRLKLKEPIYTDTAAYGHMGRASHIKKLQFEVNGEVVEREVETFTWEKLDYLDEVKTAFSL
jgi:S-adenosylmethionine synthetase